MRFLKKRPKARLKRGDTFLGDKLSATAQGYVIYKEWDAQDRKNYYWEEWELTGFDDYDSWVEYDHYTRKITVYEPIDVPVDLDPQHLKTGQSIQTTINGKIENLYVREVGTGIVERREGTLTHHVFEGEPMMYAEIAYAGGIVSVEKYNEKEYDVYKGIVLSKKQQKKMFGRTLQPLWIRENWPTALVITFFAGIFIVPLAVPSYETYCTPRTMTTTNTDQVVSQTGNQTCYRRAVYGGGSGGLGK